MLKPAKATIFPAAMFLFLAGAAAPLFGQNIELSLSRSALSFPAADPDATPLVPANDTLTVRLKLTGGGPPKPWQLTLRADGNLINILSLTSIDISNITWTASPRRRSGTGGWRPTSTSSRQRETATSTSPRL